MAFLRVALQPVPLKHKKKAKEKERRENSYHKDKVLQEMLQLLFSMIDHASRQGVNIRYADGKLRRCYPIIACWSADHAEKVQYSHSHSLKIWQFTNSQL